MPRGPGPVGSSSPRPGSRRSRSAAPGPTSWRRCAGSSTSRGGRSASTKGWNGSSWSNEHAAGQHDGALVPNPATELGDESGLAGPCLADDQGELALTGGRGGPGPLELGERITRWEPRPVRLRPQQGRQRHHGRELVRGRRADQLPDALGPRSPRPAELAGADEAGQDAAVHQEWDGCADQYLARFGPQGQRGCLRQGRPGHGRRAADLGVPHRDAQARARRDHLHRSGVPGARWRTPRQRPRCRRRRPRAPPGPARGVLDDGSRPRARPRTPTADRWRTTRTSSRSSRPRGPPARPAPGPDGTRGAEAVAALPR